MFPTITPCDSSAACSPRAACQPTTSAHAAAANHTPLLTTRTLFSKILICPLSLLSFLSRHCPNTHSLPLKPQNLKKGTIHAQQNLLRPLEPTCPFSPPFSPY